MKPCGSAGRGSPLFRSNLSAPGMEVRVGLAGLCFHVPAAWGTTWQGCSWSLRGSRSRDQASRRAQKLPEWEGRGRPGPTRPRSYQLHSLPPGNRGPFTYARARTGVHLPAQECMGRGCSRAWKSTTGDVGDWHPTTGLLSGTWKEEGEVWRNSFGLKYDAP